MTTKKQFNVRLSDRARAILRWRANKFSISEAAVLESIIRDYAPSTKKELLVQKEKRFRMRQKYLEKHPHQIPSAIWEAGYSAGWIHFQVRHEKGE